HWFACRDDHHDRSCSSLLTSPSLSTSPYLLAYSSPFFSFQIEFDLLCVSATLTEISLPSTLACHEATDRTESMSCLWRRHWRCGIRHIRSRASQLRSFHTALDDAQKSRTPSRLSLQSAYCL